MTEVALGIDIGTGSTKAGLVDGDGRLLAVGRCANEVEEPRPGWSQSDPQSWVAAARSALAAALAAVERPVEVVAVGFSGQMHGVVLCDRSMAPIRPAVLWSDQRSQPYLGEIRLRFQPAERVRLANPIVAGMAGPTMAALGREEAETVARVAHILQPKDWVRHRLTGVTATDPSDASATLLWDAVDDRWWPRACRIFDVDPGWLPPVQASDAPAGTVAGTERVDLGLSPGIPVATGAADTAAALLGAGLVSGEWQLTTGTGGQLARLTDERPTDADPTTHLFRTTGIDAGPPDRWYEMAAIQNAGIAIDWALGLLAVPLSEAGRAVAGSPVGSNGVSFLPYLTGERTPHLNGGLRGSWIGLRPGTARADLVRSVFEGVAFALRDGLDALVRRGAGPEYLLLAGGGSTEVWWQQMLADVLDRPLVPHNASDASVRGAGLLAWSSIGHRIDPGRAVQRQPPILPSAAAGDRYRKARMRFRRALPAAEIDL